MITPLFSSASGGWRSLLGFALVACLCWSWGCATPQAATPAPTTPRAPTPTAATPSAATPQPTFCDNKPIERIQENWPDGSPRFQQEVVIDEDGNEIPHGLTMHYWPNGQKKLEMGYNCGVKDGPRVTWYQDGKIWSQGEFANGKDHGHWVVWYPDGSKSQEFTMVHGRWHGVHTVWNSNGHKLREIEWVEGKRQGALRTWDEEGNLVSEVHYVDDIQQPTPRSRDRSAE